MSVPKVLESNESVVIQEVRPDEGGAADVDVQESSPV